MYKHMCRKKHLHSYTTETKYVHIKKKFVIILPKNLCNVHIWFYLDVVYRYNYDTMSLLHTYMVTRIHILNIGKNSMTYYS